MTAGQFDRVAEKLEKAARHCAAAAGYFRMRSMDRGAAHAFAAQGILRRADQGLMYLAEAYAVKNDEAS